MNTQNQNLGTELNDFYVDEHAGVETSYLIGSGEAAPVYVWSSRHPYLVDARSKGKTATHQLPASRNRTPSLGEVIAFVRADMATLGHPTDGWNVVRFYNGMVCIRLAPGKFPLESDEAPHE